MGREGKLLVQTDARQQRVYGQVERPATAGATLELTIDQYLQFVAERRAPRRGRRESRRRGSAVIMDPNTGEILAMANYPTFNPNTFGRVREEARRNRAVQDLYEPGSTFKIVTASAALEEHVIKPTDPIDCSPGRITFGSRVIRDTHEYGTLAFTDVLVKSSNVGAIKVGMRLGAERLSRDGVQQFSAKPSPPISTARTPASSGTPTASIRARSPRCRWATRSASRPCRWPLRSAPSPTAARSTSRGSCVQ
jgi:cell division protein FtsI (penicillin-binding protein 3)